MLRLYNTMSRRVEEFQPIEDNRVGLYTCGLTVYNFAHIGNLRTYISEDILKRVLRTCGYDVKHVMNITDVGHLVSDADEGEDKMAVATAREGKSAWQIAQFYTDAFQADMAKLNLLEPDIWCKATEHIPQQIELVRRLEEKGFTYRTSDGVYFDTSKLSDYGKLARLDIEGLRAGARVEVSAEKKNPTDFALWKFSPPGQQRQMEWPSPWGVGFPGWHIECSAMAMHYLGERLDIHCGGIDHVPVHHTNEIAQAEAAMGHEWVKYWVHGEFLTFPRADTGEAGKMSKSAGGFITLGTLIERGYESLAYRYFCLGAHYRQQLAFSWEGLDAAASAYDRLRRVVLAARAAVKSGDKPDQPIGEHVATFDEAAQDDLNTPRCLAAMWAAVKEADERPGEVYATLVHMNRVLGLGVEQMSEPELAITPQRIQELIDERKAARANRDFARADQIRQELVKLGVVLEDRPDGTIWRRA